LREGFALLKDFVVQFAAGFAVVRRLKLLIPDC
jgi:hypothetical protein